MSLDKHEDFLDLLITDSTTYLSVRGLNSSGRKAELVARSFVSFELKINITACSKEQKSKLESNCQEMLSKYGLVDPMPNEKKKKKKKKKELMI